LDQFTNNITTNLTATIEFFALFFNYTGIEIFEFGKS